MKTINAWLSRRPLFNLSLLLVYYLLVVLPHKQFGAFLNDHIFVGITRDQYNLLILAGGIIGLLAYGYFFIRNSRSRLYRRQLWWYAGINIFLTILIVNMLFVINVELIHLPQYAVFAILLFPLIPNYNATLFWATMAGALDEAYQYFVLAPNDTGYYDFNDVVTNLVGAVFGLLLLRSAGIDNKRTLNSCRNVMAAFVVFLGTGLSVLYFTGILSVYPSDQHAFQLVKKVPQGFWSTVYPQVTYHVIRPAEGIFLTILLLITFSKIGSSRNTPSGTLHS